MDCTCPGNCDPPRTRALGNNFNDYIIWDGFTVQADGGQKPGGIWVVGTTSRYAEGCEVRNSTINGGTDVHTFNSNVEGVRVERTNNARIANNRIFNFRETTDYANTSGIKTYHNDNLIIENNEIINCSVGVFLKSDMLRDNTVGERCPIDQRDARVREQDADGHAVGVRRVVADEHCARRGKHAKSQASAA